MITTAQRPQDDGLGRAIVISIAAHVAVVAVFVVRMVIFPSEPLTLDNAIRVDIVALPDKAPKMAVPAVEPAPPAPPVEQPPAPAPPVEQAKPVEPAKVEPVKPAAPPKVNLNAKKNTKKAQEDALKQIEALAKIEKMTKAQPKGGSRPAPVKGNQISHGTQLSGVVRLEQQGYLQTIDGAVKSHWNLPGYLANANLVARARLFIDARGNVLKRTITQSSHNDVFDQRVLTAIDGSAPLPAPPSDLTGVLENDGIELEFTPQ